MLSSLGYRRQGSRWLMKRHKFTTLVEVFTALLFIGMGVDNVWHQEHVVAGSLQGMAGAAALFCVWRFRTYIDLAEGAFVTQLPIGRRVIPFEQVRVIRAVHHSINNTFQGIYYEVEAAENAGRPMRVSRHFPVEMPAFVAALKQVMTE